MGLGVEMGYRWMVEGGMVWFFRLLVCVIECIFIMSSTLYPSSTLSFSFSSPAIKAAS